MYEKIVNNQFRYENNKLLEINFENARCTFDTNMNRYVTKKKSNGKVDMVVALINSIYLLQQDCLLNEKYYYYVGNMIVSPGQCLIEKDAISHLWLDHSIKNNGCDDFMLWIIMFHENKKITVNYDITYKHTYNGENVSADFAKMKMSSIEMMTYLSKHGIITKENEKIYMKRLKMREIYEGKNKVFKMFASLCFPKIAYELYKLKKI